LKAAAEELRWKGASRGQLAEAIEQSESVPLREAALDLLIADAAAAEAPISDDPAYPPKRPSREVPQDPAVLAAVATEYAKVSAACGRALHHTGQADFRLGTSATRKGIASTYRNETDGATPVIEYASWRAVRVKAAVALAWLRATSDLAAAVEDPRPEVREAACLGIEATAKLQSRAAGNKSEAQQQQQQQQLSGDPFLSDVVEALGERLEDEAEMVRAAAADALRAALACGAVASVENLVPKLERALRRSDSTVCSASGATRRAWRDPAAKGLFERSVKEALSIACEINGVGKRIEGA